MWACDSVNQGPEYTSIVTHPVSAGSPSPAGDPEWLSNFYSACKADAACILPDFAVIHVYRNNVKDVKDAVVSVMSFSASTSLSFGILSQLSTIRGFPNTPVWVTVSQAALSTEAGY